ncbi:unnamed protein product [Adineta steineri]|uniref:Uncharacterized protein n=1 Tax=Adineta steineri TaxID=433720 RepID=A0A815R695_9BILA|nr:unnamed protein product [Adineta steineri]CAF1472991.1 unnamed protein product [Adineta steineri]
MLKLIYSHLSTNNRFPSINSYSKSSFGDFRGLNGGRTTNIHSNSKRQHVQQQQQQQQSTTNQQRRITYRSSDYSWSDHPTNSNVSNPLSRTDNTIKTKLSTSSRNLANGITHEYATNSMPHLSTQTGHHQNIKTDSSNADLHGSTGIKLQNTNTRNQRTSINLDKTSGSNGFNLPTRHASFNSTRLDHNIYPRQIPSKQRNYVSSKASFHDTSGGDLYLSSLQDENSYYFHQQQQQQPNPMSSTQRLNGSTFDIATSRKPYSITKSNTMNTQANAANYQSLQELHRSDSALEKNHLTRFAIRGTTASKEQHSTTPRHRQPSTIPTNAVSTLGFISDERQSSVVSYVSRDPNISYAYTDVKKYIEENDLMSPEKEISIKNWIIDVEKYRHEFGKSE